MEYPTPSRGSPRPWPAALALLSGCVLVPAEDRWWPLAGTADSEVNTGDTTIDTADTYDTPEIDADGDGYPASEDCDDQNNTINPGEVDVKCDGVDDNCSGDEADASKAAIWYADVDGDGFGDAASSTRGCEQPSGFVGDNSDCDDATGEKSPAEDEICADGVDNDCDGVDQGCALFGDIDLADADAKLVGANADDWAGLSVAGGADVTGDGLDDLLIGAHRNGDNGENAGATYVVSEPLSGVSALSAAYHATIYGEAPSDGAGSSVSFAGDVDGDGYEEVLIAASGSDREQIDGGTVYLMEGPLSGQLYLSEADAFRFGQYAAQGIGVVARGGDLNGDAKGDILIGSERWGDWGAVYVLQGPITGQHAVSTTTAILTGEALGDQAGRSVAGAGDVNGDGLDDVLVGAWLADGYAGAAYLVQGPISGQSSLGDADVKLTGEALGYAGVAVAGAGDVDADGLSDLLIGAHKALIGKEEFGAAYVVYGRESLGGTIGLADADVKLLGEEAGDSAGYSVASAGDVDLDERDDLLIGIFPKEDGGSVNGVVYLARGPLSGTMSLADAGARLFGEEQDDYVGCAVAGAGDVDGDGGFDVLIGAYGEDSGGHDAGAAYLLYGNAP